MATENSEWGAVGRKVAGYADDRWDAWTLERLAEGLGVAKSTASRLMRMDRLRSADMVRRLCALFSTKPQAWMGEE
jgi:plasmid maintenance system antidote protein VapI